MICQGLGTGLVAIFGFFIEPLAKEFDASVASINMAPVFLLVVPGLIGPLIGKFADKMSIKNIMLCGLLIAMGSLYGIALADNIQLATLGFLGFALGLSMYGPITANAILIKIYESEVGRALAIAAMGVSIATTLMPPVVAWLMSNYEWRKTLMIISVAITFVLTFVIIKGLPNTTGTADEAAETEKDDAPSPYLKDRAFWQIGLAVALAFNAALIIGISYPPHFSNMGFGLKEAALLVSAAGFAGFIGKAAIASVADRLRSKVKYLAAFLLLLEVIGVALMMFITDYYMMLIVVAALGIGGGAFIPMHPYLNSAYFSGDIIGRINGAQMPLFLPFGLVGPPLAGYAFDTTGSYLPAFAGVGVALFLATLLLLFLPNVEETTLEPCPA